MISKDNMLKISETHIYFSWVGTADKWVSPSISKRKNHCIIITIKSSESKILTGTQVEPEPFLATFQILTPSTQQWFYGECIDAVSYFTDVSLKNILKVIYREMPSFNWLSFPWVKSAQWLVRLSRPSNHFICWKRQCPRMVQMVAEALTDL